MNARIVSLCTCRSHDTYSVLYSVTVTVHALVKLGPVCVCMSVCVNVYWGGGGSVCRSVCVCVCVCVSSVGGVRLCVVYGGSVCWSMCVCVCVLSV